MIALFCPNRAGRPNLLLQRLFRSVAESALMVRWCHLILCAHNRGGCHLDSNRRGAYDANAAPGELLAVCRIPQFGDGRVGAELTERSQRDRHCKNWSTLLFRKKYPFVDHIKTCFEMSILYKQEASCSMAGKGWSFQALPFRKWGRKWWLFGGVLPGLSNTFS